MDLGLSGRRALICGGSKGLGFAAAQALAREGVDLVLVSRTAEALEQAARQIVDETGVKVTTVAADLSLADAPATVLAACPDPDILVCNPGVRQTPDDFRTLSRADWDFWMEAHYFGPLELIRAIVPSMCERKFGRVVNISVSNIKFPQVNFAHSHSARVGLAGAIASMVRELVPHNVVINSVLPGFIDTDALRTNRIKMTPANRFAAPSECGDLIAYLCSAQIGFMTGQNIVIDGGVYQGLF